MYTFNVKQEGKNRKILVAAESEEETFLELDDVLFVGTVRFHLHRFRDKTWRKKWQQNSDASKQHV
jgi:hypothetical protein